MVAAVVELAAVGAWKFQVKPLTVLIVLQMPPFL